MSRGTLAVALIHEIFASSDGSERLRSRLREAREAGAELAILPELPLDGWAPAGRNARDEDAEAPGGPRHETMAAAAREAGIGLLGGLILADPRSRRRSNRALLFDAAGRLVASYDKLHIPSEEGFWESDHYEEGGEPPRPIDGFGLRLGIQICSDLNRPQGCQLLAARGAEAILAPRATPGASYDRWLLVSRANALTSAAYVVSVNRPGPEAGVDVGGASFVVGPDGGVVAETTDPVRVVALERAAVSAARRDYPGYLTFRPELFGRGWSEVEG